MFCCSGGFLHTSTRIALPESIHLAAFVSTRTLFSRPPLLVSGNFCTFSHCWARAALSQDFAGKARTLGQLTLDSVDTDEFLAEVAAAAEC